MSAQLQPSASRLIDNLFKRDIAMRKTEFISHVVSRIMTSEDKKELTFEVLTDCCETRFIISTEKCLEIVELVLQSGLRAQARSLISMSTEKVKEL
jgi:hypothetical protein